jgi:glutathione synthase/RimK-type ligase-like ATP-grasp enzyme
MDEFNNLLKDICKELDIKLTIFPDGWLKILEKGNIAHYISGYRFDNNCYAVGEIMNDKGLFHDVLVYKNLPIVEQKILFNDYDKNEVFDYFIKNHKEIIIKGNTGNAGKEVFKVTDEKEMFNIINKLFLKEYSISLSPYYDIENEYRLVVLNNEVRLLFGKIKPFIVGDGKKTIKELIENKNYLMQYNNPDYIPQVNERIDLDFKFNLSNGGEVLLDISNELKDKLSALALDVSNKLNISFASIDIIVTKTKEILILEANTGVTLNNFVKKCPEYKLEVYNIYKDAIKLMFN